MIICNAISDAGINTVICLAVVFTVLIFISFLISLFKYIPKLEAALSKKDKKTELAENAVVNTVSQIEVKEEEEELSDDLELVAVITAAIAASAGTSTDGFVVRSIRRSNNSKWAKA
jgi:Na+-transporting methylmalonyl-CoA/oxaloacetate decarboxylase gamma subunit